MFGSKNMPELIEEKKSPSPMVYSTIAKGVNFSGDVNGDGDVYIDGNFEGNIKCKKLIVGITGNINGNINVDIFIVHGVFKGKATAKSVQLMNSAIVTGDIYHDILEISAGARIDGQYSQNSKKNKHDNIRNNIDKMISLKPVKNNNKIKIEASNIMK